MSHPSRPWARGTSPRRVRVFRLDPVNPLEERCVLTPYLPLTPDTATFTAAATPTNTDLGTVTVTPGAATVTKSTTPNTTFITAAPVTSVGELTPLSSFGGDIVRLAAGPGGVFGDGLYAISRGAGGSSTAVNNPGVIYRVDPATGKASVFFDLNTVINQKELDGTAANSVGPSTGLVNWYDITFDPEGYFDGTPSMFVASADASDPNKNIIYQIGASGNLIGVFTQFTAGESALKFDVNPTAILIPPVQDQSFLRGMFAGSGESSTATAGTAFTALYFDSNQYQPGQVLSNTTLPTGVSETDLTNGPIVGMTASNIDYASAVYSAFTDFGTPAAGGIPARPGLSGVQGLGGEYLIQPPAGTTAATLPTLPLDEQPVVSSLGRRFEDIAFDQYGYFSQGFTLTTNTTTTAGGQNGDLVDGLYSISQPINAGSVFVTDLASGLQVSVTPQAPLPTAAVEVPVQSSGTVGVESNGSGGVSPILQPLSTGGSNTTGNPGTPGVDSTGGRILRILPNGTVSVFAEGFDTSGAQDSTSFQQSSLSIAFSADGTTLYASDNDAIWQFKTVTDLASATSGSLIGLNDLRTLAVPYDGLGSAVAIVDTGVDANSTPFRGRVSQGINVVTNGFGNDDLAPAPTTTTTTTTTNNTTGTTAGGTVVSTGNDGHGTLVAGVVAQFVPQATLVPVDVFNPFQLTTSFKPTAGAGSTTTGGTTGGTTSTGTAVSNTSNAITSSQDVWLGMQYVATHPYVADPVRPNTVDRVVAATFAFGTNETFASEGDAYRRYPQVVNALKFQLHKFLKLGIAPIAAAGELGEPYAAGVASATGTGGTTGGGTTTTGKGSTTGSGTTGTGNGLFGNDNSDNSNVGDDNGMSLPAILNEVISVTGVIPFPFTATPSTPPTDPPQGIIPRPTGPILVYTGNTIGGTSGSTTTTSSSTTNTNGNNLNLLTAGNYAIYSDEMLASSNRSNSTDFAAPAIDVPTFRRTFTPTTTTTGTATTTTDPTDHLVFNQGGTSLASAEVTGAYAMVSSALNYWTQLSQANGVTSDAYLTTPVGVDSLNFGAGSVLNLNAWNNPNGINGILAWTAVPVADTNNGLTASTPATLIGSNNYKSYARISVSNAVAAIEGYEALNYLISHNDLQYLESNNDGLISAQSIQDFVDNSTAMGMPEAGAMARLLGGTATSPTPTATAAGENPDQPGALQRRFNFFDYAADGQLNGSVTVSQLEMLAHTLLPAPDAYTITNRAAASVNGFLIDPSAQRNFKNLQHILPRFEYAPLTLNRAYANSSPASYRVDRNVPPGVNFPVYALFSSSYLGTTGSTSSTSSSSSTATPAATPASSSSTTTTSPTTAATTTGTTTTATTGTTTDASTSSTTSGTTSANQIALQLINDAIQIAQQSNNAPNQPVPAGTIASTDTSTTGSSTTNASTTGSSTTGSSATTLSTTSATDPTTTATPVDSTTPTSTPTAVTSTGTSTSTTTSTTGSTSSTTKSNSTSGGTTA